MFEAAIYPGTETMSRTALLLLGCSGQPEDLAKAMGGIWVPNVSKTEVTSSTPVNVRLRVTLFHQRELQQQRALDHREIVVGDHGQNGVALRRNVGVDALHVVDLVA